MVWSGLSPHSIPYLLLTVGQPSTLMLLSPSSALGVCGRGWRGMIFKVKHPISGFLEHNLERCTQLTRQLNANLTILTEFTIGDLEMWEISVLKNGKCLHVEGLGFCSWKPLWTGGQGRIPLCRAEHWQMCRTGAHWRALEPGRSAIYYYR